MKLLKAMTLPAVFAVAALLAGGAAADKAKQTKCPMSGKPCKKEFSLEVNGSKVYFCCKNCPKAFKEKQLAAVKAEKKCPLSGRPAKAETALLQAEKVYFCCNNCAKKFAKQKGFKTDVPANKKCPISGEEVDENVSVTVNGHKVFFCCKGCVKKYEKQLLHATDKGPTQCPLSGRPAKKETGQIFVREVAFCCNNCRAKYAKKNFQTSAE